MDEQQVAEQAVYQITVKGLLDQRWTHWFDTMKILPDPANGETKITGLVVDQAALYGHLARVRDLGLTLLAVRRIEGPD